MTRIKQEKGFTLIEATVALAILSIGILSLILLLTSGISGNASADRITRETAYAADQIEKFVGMEYNDSDLDDTNNTVPSSNVSDVEKYLLSGSTDYDYPADHSETSGNYDIMWNVQKDYPCKNTKTVIIIVKNTNIDSEESTFRYVKAK